MRHDTQFALDLKQAEPMPLDQALWGGELPDAPLAMPKQVLERRVGLFAWLRSLPLVLSPRA
jgi:hypothetical protein